METWLDSFIQRLIKEGVAIADEIVGCTPSEIDEIERAQKTPLPPVKGIKRRAPKWRQKAFYF
ncbi:hypothetical protein LLG95_18535 [bacterium]|nr:hypothetical protein [bacterium]